MGFQEFLELTLICQSNRTDSDLSIKLLRGLGLPWKSQLLEIWTDWLQERVELGELRIHYERGSNNPADALAPWDG